MGAKKLQMSAQEIVTSYKTAADPKKQIGILAELNACTVGEIEAVLIQLGAMEKSDRRKPHPRAVQVDGDKARELLAQGLTDEETADALGVGLGKFRDWRRGEGIRPNREKKTWNSVGTEETAPQEQSVDNRDVAAPAAEEAQTGAAQACPCMTVARLHDILTAAMACRMGNAVITVKGQRFSTMALRISFSIGAEAESVAELVAEVEA